MKRIPRQKKRAPVGRPGKLDARPRDAAEHFGAAQPGGDAQADVHAGRLGRFAAWYLGLSAQGRFGAEFCLLLVLLYGISLTPWVQSAIQGGLSLDASLSGSLLRAMGWANRVSQDSVTSGSFSMRVSRGCDAVEVIAFYWAAIMAFPAPFARKAVGLALGGAILFGLNLLRLSSLFVIGLYHPVAFEPFHLQIWPVLLMIAALLLLAGWIKWAARSDFTDGHGAS